MIVKTTKRERRRKRHMRSRNKLVGTADKPRLTVCKSNKHLYAQLVNDTEAKTLMYLSTLQPSIKTKLKSPSNNKEAAKLIGEELGKLAVEKGIKSIVFDKGGSQYHGKISALADGARAQGLKF